MGLSIVYIKYCWNVLCFARCLRQIPTIHPDGKPDCADWDPYPVSSGELWQSTARELWADAEGEMVRQLSFIPCFTGIQNTVPFHNQETCFFRSTAKLQSFQSVHQIVFFWVVNATDNDIIQFLQNVWTRELMCAGKVRLTFIAPWGWCFRSSDTFHPIISFTLLNSLFKLFL